jgi:hypothetical protein
MPYTLTQQEFRRHKANLTRAQNSGDPWKVLAAVKAAREQFQREGFPDNWNNWRNAASDLAFNRLNDGYPDFDVQDAARAEEDRWF